MYVIDKENKVPKKIEETTFSIQGLKERYDLQEWIVSAPEILGEELLIIQKEFSGFSDTNERLDLLAIDKQGNLVIIENKLDDSGKDVMWQATKYASYCSTLTKDNILEIYQKYLNQYENSKDDNMAKIKIVEFFDNSEYEEILLNQGQSQRIILVAANFRKEVTSTVLWLRQFNINIKCVKIKPYLFDNRLFIDAEAIIPVTEVEEYTITIERKNQSEQVNTAKLAERHKIRLKFWEKLLVEINNKTDLCRNINPSKDHWLNVGSGFSGVCYTFIITQNYAGIELEIARSIVEENKAIFDYLYANKENIEMNYGKPLEWERLDDKKMSRIAYRLKGVNIFNEVDHEQMRNFLVKEMIAFNQVLKGEIETIKKKKDLFK